MPEVRVRVRVRVRVKVKVRVRVRVVEQSEVCLRIGGCGMGQAG